MSKKIITVKFLYKFFLWSINYFFNIFLLIVILLFPEVNSLEEWEYYSSEVKEVSTPLCWPSGYIPYSFKGNFLKLEKYVIQEVLKIV